MHAEFSLREAKYKVFINYLCMVLFFHMTGPKANEFLLHNPLLKNTKSQEDCGGKTYYPMYSVFSREIACSQKFFQLLSKIRFESRQICEFQFYSNQIYFLLRIY